MNEQQKQDSRELATMLEALPKEDRLQVRGVILGMQMAKTGYITDSAPGQPRT